MLTTLSRLWSAFARLATAVEDLAGTTEEVNHGVRAQLGLPAQAARLQPPEHEAVEGELVSAGANGRARRRQ